MLVSVRLRVPLDTYKLSTYERQCIEIRKPMGLAMDNQPNI